MFCVIHSGYNTIGKGTTIAAAVENWSDDAGVSVDDEIFQEFIFIEGEEIKVQRIISYEKVAQHEQEC